MEGGEKTVAANEEGNRMQKGNSHQESHQCITNVVKSSAIPSGILRMNGFYCSVLITDCCYSSSSFYFYCICAVVDRVLMMMVMIMTLLATRWSNENKTEIIALFFTGLK